MTPESRARIEELLTGYASAQRQLLFDRNGSPGKWDNPSDFVRPQYYWCPSVRIGRKQNGVVGPSKFVGHYSRKEAVAEAQRFLDTCRDLLDKELAKESESAQPL